MEKKLYKMARKLNKMASTVKDVKTVASGDPKKIVKRYISKQTYKNSHKSANKFSQWFTKLFK